jgi:tetratricopeptide (TPR) repeat protein
VLVASQGGINFFIGNNPGADGVSAVVPEIEARHGDFDEHVAIARQALGPAAKPSEISAWWTRRGREFIAAEPGTWTRLQLRKAYLYWNAHEIGNNRVIRFVTDFSTLATYVSVKFWIIAPLAAAGLWLALAQGRDVGLLVLYVTAYFGATILYFVNARFRMPILPALLLLAGHAIVCLQHAVRERQVKRVAPALVVFGVVALAIWPYPPLLRGEINGHYQDALMFAKAGDRDNALRELLQARALKPDAVATHLALGRLYLEGFGDLPSSVRSFEDAIRLAPGDPAPIHDLGVAYLGAGRYGDAEAQFRRVLQMAPRHVKALDNLAYACEKQGRPEDARRAYEQLLEIAPDFPGARAKLEAWRGRAAP